MGLSRKYATDEDRRAAKAQRQREYEARKREDRERTSPRKPSDEAFPPTPCACGCGRRLDGRIGYGGKRLRDERLRGVRNPDNEAAGGRRTFAGRPGERTPSRGFDRWAKFY